MSRTLGLSDDIVVEKQRQLWRRADNQSPAMFSRLALVAFPSFRQPLRSFTSNAHIMEPLTKKTKTSKVHSVLLTYVYAASDSLACRL